MNNYEKQKLEDFSLPQLHILLKHLNLGYEHLKLVLTQKQLDDLLSWSEICQDKKDLVSSTKVEKLGNMYLIINTILTSTFGAWMGLSGCIGFGLGSFKMIAVISIIAFFVSGLIGFISLNYTENQAYKAIFNLKLQQLQLDVLKLIRKKIREKAEEAEFYLNTAVSLLNKEAKVSNVSFRTKEEAYEWFDTLSAVLKERLEEVKGEELYEFYQKQIDQICHLIKKTLAKHYQFLNHMSLMAQKEKKRLQIRSTLPFLKVLTNPVFGVPKYKALANTSWIKGNFYELFLGLTPTIWGGFASMFVFVGGFPNIARELGFVDLANSLTHPTARAFELTMAALITGYFAFSYLYSYRKSSHRQSLMEQMKKETANEETAIFENNHKLDMLYKLKLYSKKLISVFNVLKKVEISK